MRVAAPPVGVRRTNETANQRCGRHELCRIARRPGRWTSALTSRSCGTAYLKRTQARSAPHSPPNGTCASRGRRSAESTYPVLANTGHGWLWEMHTDGWWSAESTYPVLANTGHGWLWEMHTDGWWDASYAGDAMYCGEYSAESTTPGRTRPDELERAHVGSNHPVVERWTRAVATHGDHKGRAILCGC
jgi:hypothetical protein